MRICLFLSACLDEEVINRVFLELKATSGITWTTFLADLGYNSKNLLKLTVDQKDIYFNPYLQYWLETVTQLGFNPTVYLYRAVIQTQDKPLVDKFRRLFNNSGEYLLINFYICLYQNIPKGHIRIACGKSIFQQ